MHNGTVKWFNATKGYGFITDDADKSEIFVSLSNYNFSDPSFLRGLFRKYLSKFSAG